MKCNHEWKNDELFESGAVKIIFGQLGYLKEEMRQVCDKCQKVRYIPKEADK